MHVKVTKGTDMWEHVGHGSHEVLHFTMGWGAHPALHKHAVGGGHGHGRAHAQPTVRVVGKLGILTLPAANAGAAA